MKPLFILCILAGLATSAALARGGMSSHASHMSSSPMSPASGGALGTSAGTPGTNSLGTAISSSGIGTRMSGPTRSITPPLDANESRVHKAIGSICRGC